MSKHTIKRLFWIIFFIFFGMLIYFFPHKENSKEKEIEQQELNKKNNIVSSKNSNINILIISDGGINNDVYKSTDSIKNFGDLLKENGFVWEEISTPCTKTKTQLNYLKYIDLTQYDNYVINLGYGDYTHNVPLYIQESDTSYYYETKQLIAYIKQKNPKAKIIFVTDKNIEHITKKNKSNYNYLDYLEVLTYITEKENIQLVNMYNYTKNNITKIKDENSLTFSLSEQEYLFNQIKLNLIDNIK